MLAMNRNAFDICLGVRFDEKKFYTYHNMPVALSELQTLFVDVYTCITCLYLVNFLRCGFYSFCLTTPREHNASLDG